MTWTSTPCARSTSPTCARRRPTCWSGSCRRTSRRSTRRSSSCARTSASRSRRTTSGCARSTWTPRRARRRRGAPRRPRRSDRGRAADPPAARARTAVVSTHDGFFGPDSMLRRVISETLVGLSAPQVLLLQAAHPVAWAGFFAHTGALDAPYERLDRTALIMNTVAFGSREHAERATARVRAMHTRVTGVLGEAAGRFPAGTPYSATDPALLMWILATLAAGGSAAYRRWVGPLSRDEL